MAEPLDPRLSSPIDGGPTFSLGNRLLRLAWSAAWLLLARWTPPGWRDWRCALLRAFGARIAPGADVRPSARVWYPPHLTLGRRAVLAAGVNCYNVAPISLGEDALVSQGATLCAASHDIDDPLFPLVRKPIAIAAHAWVASEAFVGPGVSVGEGAVLGARGVAFRDLAPWTVHTGNPARPGRPRRH